jgi:RNA polymerase sigma-B factor
MPRTSRASTTLTEPTLRSVPDAAASGSDERREAEAEAFRLLRRTGDAALRAQLIEDHIWLAHHAARRFGNSGELRDDLVQVASLALIHAVDRFDPSRGTRFTTYAMPTMLGELRRHFRDKTWAMRVPRRGKDLHLEARAMRDELTGRLGRSPNVDELAGALDTTPEEVLEALEAGANYRAASLDAPSADGTRPGPGATYGADDERLLDSAERLMLNEALAELPERDREVIYLYYFGDLTQLEIAASVGVSQVHISRILRKSLATLRGTLASA